MGGFSKLGPLFRSQEFQNSTAPLQKKDPERDPNYFRELPTSVLAMSPWLMIWHSCILPLRQIHILLPGTARCICKHRTSIALLKTTCYRSILAPKTAKPQSFNY